MSWARELGAWGGVSWDNARLGGARSSRGLVLWSGVVVLGAWELGRARGRVRHVGGAGVQGS